MLNAFVPSWRGLRGRTAACLVATSVVAVLLVPEFFFGLDLRRSVEPLLVAAAATAVACFFSIVARARWHWATKTLILLGSVLCVLPLVLRMLVASMTGEGPSLKLSNGCTIEVLHVGAFGDSGDVVGQRCAVASLWTRHTPLTYFGRATVEDLALVSRTTGEDLIALTIVEYPKQPFTVTLPLPGRK